MANSIARAKADAQASNDRATADHTRAVNMRQPTIDHEKHISVAEQSDWTDQVVRENTHRTTMAGAYAVHAIADAQANGQHAVAMAKAQKAFELRVPHSNPPQYDEEWNNAVAAADAAQVRSEAAADRAWSISAADADATQAQGDATAAKALTETLAGYDKTLAYTQAAKDALRDSDYTEAQITQWIDQTAADNLWNKNVSIAKADFITAGYAAEATATGTMANAMNAPTPKLLGAPWATFRAGFAVAKVTWWGGVKSSYLAKADEANSKATTFQDQVNGYYRTEIGTKSTANETNAQRTADADYTHQINQADANYVCDTGTADAVANFARATAQIAYATAVGATPTRTAAEVLAAYQRELAVAEGRRSIAMEGANQTFATSSGQAEVDWTRDVGAAARTYADAESAAYATMRSELAAIDAGYLQQEADTFATAAASFPGSDTPWGGYESGKAAACKTWSDSVSPAAETHATGVADLDSSLEQQIAAADELFANQSAAADRLDGVASAAAAVAHAVLDALGLVNASPAPDVPTTPASVEVAIDAIRPADFGVATARAVADAGHETLKTAIHVSPWSIAADDVFGAALAVGEYHPYPNAPNTNWSGELTDEPSHRFVWTVPFKADQTFGASPELEHGLITQPPTVGNPPPPDLSLGLRSATLRDQIVPPSSISQTEILADSAIQLFVDLFGAPESLIAVPESPIGSIAGELAGTNPESSSAGDAVLASTSAGGGSDHQQPTDDLRNDQNSMALEASQMGDGPMDRTNPRWLEEVIHICAAGKITELKKHSIANVMLSENGERIVIVFWDSSKGKLVRGTLTIARLKKTVKDLEERNWLRSMAGLVPDVAPPKTFTLAPATRRPAPTAGQRGPAAVIQLSDDWREQDMRRRFGVARDIVRSAGASPQEPNKVYKTVDGALNTTANCITMGGVLLKDAWFDPLKGVFQAVAESIEDMARTVDEVLKDPFGTPFEIGNQLFTAVTTIPEWGSAAVAQFVNVMSGNNAVAKGQVLGAIWLMAIPGPGEVALSKLSKVTREIRTALKGSENVDKAMEVARTFVREEGYIVRIGEDGKTIQGARATEAEIKKVATKLVNEAQHDAELFSIIRGRDLTKLDPKETGKLGETIAKRMLQDKEFTDIFSIQNASNNGIDIVARSTDGKIHFFEVKASAKGRVRGLTERQKDMEKFVDEILQKAAKGTHPYQNIDAKLKAAAMKIYQELDDSTDYLGSVIKVDLLKEILIVVPW